MNQHEIGHAEILELRTSAGELTTFRNLVPKENPGRLAEPGPKVSGSPTQEGQATAGCVEVTTPSEILSAYRQPRSSFLTYPGVYYH
jgi:hypothetical protein